MERSVLEEKLYKSKLRFKVLIAVVVTAILLIELNQCYYDLYIDGRSYIGTFKGDAYYYTAENNHYKWTEEEGKQLLKDKEDDVIYPDEYYREQNIKYGKYVLEYGDSDNKYGESLYYISNTGERKLITHFRYSHFFIIINGTYLIAHTDCYIDSNSGKQGAVYCYKIEYDNANKRVIDTRLIDIVYD
ncbi:MAG: hypothetical protein HFE90_00835 [Firmicutes bacterium]|nr:hypothetical protein [Bacillota bacterium]